MKKIVKSSKCIDLHTHLYLPKYIEILKSRKNIPRVTPQNTLIILPNESQQGRPIGDEYVSIENKLKFMRLHDISQSVISLANPWADFLDDANLVTQLNIDLLNICEKSQDKLLGLAVLPTGCSIENMIQEIERIADMKQFVKGIIFSLNGVGKGLHDEKLIDVYAKLAEHNLLIFTHPHYGVGNYDPKYGHILPLAFGFTFETTQRIGELIISGMLDRFDHRLQFLLAHGGGTLPYLSGRFDSCYQHDHHLFYKLKRYENPSDYLKNCFLYDSITYNHESFKSLKEFAGIDRIVFGTDHPFFPPVNVPNQLDKNDLQWESCLQNQKLISQYCTQQEQDKINYLNAENLFKQ